MTAPPCIGRQNIYDTALFDTVPTSARVRALHQAAALCASCLTPCEQKITVSSQRSELVLLEPGWMPPVRKVRREAEVRRLTSVSSDYVPPARRAAVWAAWAVELAAAGMPLAKIADELCVTEGTAARLLDAGKAVAA